MGRGAEPGKGLSHRLYLLPSCLAVPGAWMQGPPCPSVPPPRSAILWQGAAAAWGCLQVRSRVPRCGGAARHAGTALKVKPEGSRGNESMV